MTDGDKQAFAAMMTALAENFGQTVTPAGISLRFAALKAHGIDAITSAAMSILTQRKYTTMPTVADFVEHLGGGSADDKAEVEAGKVLDAIGRVGGYRSVAFDDAVTQAVVQNVFGGWPQLCAEMSMQDRQWWRKEFVRAYASYARQGVTLTGHLAGISEMQNGARGVASDEPLALVGNRNTALKIAGDGGGTEVKFSSFGMARALPYDKSEWIAL